MVVSKLVEAINLLVPEHEEIFQNKIMTIRKGLRKNDRELNPKSDQTFGSGVNIVIKRISLQMTH
jgi:hypothetical protein